MNKNYRLVWSAKYFCWQAVSEIAKGGVVAKRSSTKKTASHTAKLVLFFVANLLSVSVALAGPTGGTVSSGNATITTFGTTTTINQSTSKAEIDWSSFSTNSNEVVNFVQPSSSSITLNRVTGTSASTLNGQLNANGQVFIVNPNGVLFSSTSQVNVGGLIASTLNLSNSDFNNNTFNFTNTANNKTVENRGKIIVPTGGTVALIAPSVKHTGTIKAPQGNVLLAAGGDITLNLNNGSLLGYTINQGKAQALINSGGMIQADGGKVVLTAKGIDELSNAVVNSVGVVQAQTVNNVRGVIELGSDLDSGSGTVNVSGTLDASAPNGGNGGQIKTTASNVNISSGTTVTTQRNTTSSLPPTTSGWELKAKNVDVDFFGGTVSSTTISDALNRGNVTLNAVGTGDGQGNININDATSWNANTALSLNATKDINFNSDLDLSADKAKLVMNYGVGSDYNLNNGSKINITGSAPTLLINGTSYIVINSLGEEGDANINTLQGMNNNLNGNYALGGDIDASDTVNWNEGKGFNQIGTYGRLLTIFNDPTVPEGINSTESKIERPFNGEFHGLGHTVNDLYINNTVGFPDTLPAVLPATFIFNESTGLFGLTTNTIRNIGVVGGNIIGWENVGGLIGIQKTGIVSNSYSSSAIQGNYNIGGLIGSSGFKGIDGNISSGKVLNSYATGDVLIGSFESNVIGSWAQSVGGLIGKSFSVIKDSYATGNISSVDIPSEVEFSQQLIGGLVGEQNNADVINSYATGNIVGNFDRVGGLIGSLVYSKNGDIGVYNSYTTGNIDVKNNAGGLVGFIAPSDYDEGHNSNNYNSKVKINNSFTLGNIKTSKVDDYDNATGGLLGAAFGMGIININSSYNLGDVSGWNATGGLVGFSTSFGGINNSYSTGNVYGNNHVGGLVGVSNAPINNSYYNGSVYGNNGVGGIAGFNMSSINNVTVKGSVIGAFDYIGGIAGSSMNGAVSNSISETNVTGRDIVGGAIGYFQGNLKSPIITENVVVSGNVKGNNDVGGLVGKAYGGYLNNIWSGDIINSNVNSLSIIGNNNVGGLVGNSLANISNSKVSTKVIGNENVGGLIGRDDQVPNAYGEIAGSLRDSIFNGDVSGHTSVGGLIGIHQYDAIVSSSASNGFVHGVENVGGLIGLNQGKVYNSYSLSSVVGDNNVGGLIGLSRYTNGYVENSYSAGTVFGINNVGGLIGNRITGSTIVNSYWNTETSGQLISAGGVGKTTAELKQITTFAGWDIADVSDPNSTSTWVIDENNSTPILRYNH